jgi:hypothetical protein
MTTVNDYSKTCTYLGVDYDARTHRGPSPYCGAASTEHSSYCSTHYPIVYQAGTANRRRHKDIRRAEAVHTLESLFHECVAELEAEGELTLD